MKHPVTAMLLLLFAGTSAVHACTTWIAMPDMTGGKCIMLHKNRDSQANDLCMHKQMAAKGKLAWIGMGNVKGRTSIGINSCGLAVAMNGGDVCEAKDNPKGTVTSRIGVLLLERCKTADEAVKELHRIVIKDRNYRHGKYGSIWFFVDKNKTFIVEHDAKNFAVHQVAGGLATRANAWHYPEMVIHSRLDANGLVKQLRREFAVREFLIGTGKPKVLTHNEIAGSSRISELPPPRCYPPCGRITNCAATAVIDREYPEQLSTLFCAAGPPQYTVYLPVPLLIDKLPEELTGGSYSQKALLRLKDKRLLMPLDELAAFEKELNKTHDAAVEKARNMLKKGASVEEVSKVLSDAFRANWKKVSSLKEPENSPQFWQKFKSLFQF